MGLKEVYISVDVEASGPSIEKNSMLSIGACVVGDNDLNFYKELKPTSLEYDSKAMTIASLGLDALKPLFSNSKFNPKKNDFRPDLVLKVLENSAQDSLSVMRGFYKWIKENSYGRKPIFIAFGAGFDWDYVDHYFKRNDLINPFGFSPLDIKSYAMGKLNLSNWSDTSGKKLFEILGLELKNEHNALEDAIEQANLFEKLRNYN